MVNVSTEAGRRTAFLAANLIGDSRTDAVGSLRLARTLPTSTPDLTISARDIPPHRGSA